MKNNRNLNNLIKIEISQAKLIAIFATSVLFYIVAIILWKQKNIDNSIVIHFNYVYENDSYLKLIKTFSHYGMSFITALYTLFLILTFKNENLKSERPLFLMILFSFAIAGIGGDLLKEIIDKARPIITLSGQIAIEKIHETPAFPSGHATKSIALALPFILLASRKNSFVTIIKILVLISALIVCYTRVALQAHFFSDVLAGIGTALFFFPFTILFVNLVYRKKKVDIDKLNLMSKVFIFVFTGLTVLLFSL